ncbi:MAG: hypothetical protein J6E43_01060 [Prevotella sp.]|nr:hypothetical protein [Prevotella sp.]
METEDIRQRISKLEKSQSIISTGLEFDGLYDLTNKAAEKYIRQHFRGSYVNADTGDIIRITIMRSHQLRNKNSSEVLTR